MILFRFSSAESEAIHLVIDRSDVKDGYERSYVTAIARKVKPDVAIEFRREAAGSLYALLGIALLEDPMTLPEDVVAVVRRLFTRMAPTCQQVLDSLPQRNARTTK